MRRLLMGSALLLVVGCNETTEPEATRRIELAASAFEPATITVEQGTEITWINTQPIEHTITPDQHTQWAAQEMTSNGQTFSVSMDVPGTYAYFCEIHPAMIGTITVTPN